MHTLKWIWITTFVHLLWFILKLWSTSVVMKISEWDEFPRVNAFANFCGVPFFFVCMLFWMFGSADSTSFMLNSKSLPLSAIRSPEVLAYLRLLKHSVQCACPVSSLCYVACQVKLVVSYYLVLKFLSFLLEDDYVTFGSSTEKQVFPKKKKSNLSKMFISKRKMKKSIPNSSSLLRSIAKRTKKNPKIKTSNS